MLLTLSENSLFPQRINITINRGTFDHSVSANMPYKDVGYNFEQTFIHQVNVWTTDRTGSIIKSWRNEFLLENPTKIIMDFNTQTESGLTVGKFVLCKLPE